MAGKQSPGPVYPEWPKNDIYQYAFLNNGLNSLQFFDTAQIRPLFNKLKQAQKRKVQILYIGDSHVQADDFTGEIRNRMQQAFGFGGRGMVFPFSTARTHAAVDYTTEHTGRWHYAKNVEPYPELSLGISGATSRTVDSIASFKLHFRGTIRPEFTKLRIFCKRSASSYDLRIKSGLSDLTIDVYNKETGDTTGVLDVILPKGENDLGFYMRKTDSAQREFEIYGISIESAENAGVVFHSVGINGAGHYSILRQNLMARQLQQLKPDAVILDLGANDFYRGGINKQEFYNNLSKVVKNIRQALPEITIILSNSQDIYRGGYSLPDCASFSSITREFSKENGCAFYDWYWVSGGRYSMLKWSSSQLAKWDLVHLTHQGYVLKGQMIAKAIENTYQWLDTAKMSNRLIYNIDSLTNPPIDTTVKPATQPVIRYQWIYHRVLRGQTIWSIASWYGVTAYQIKVWNRMRSNYLWIGQVLKIYAPIKTQVPVTPTPKPKEEQQPIQTPAPTPVPKPPVNPPKPYVQPKPKPAPQPRAVYHKVKSGQTLFSISRMYGTSTSAIMKLNGMRSHTIRPGQVLRVK
jgi:LysM repeat protein/lysophospholipase L1-like esterase